MQHGSASTLVLQLRNNEALGVPRGPRLLLACSGVSMGTGLAACRPQGNASGGCSELGLFCLWF